MVCQRTFLLKNDGGRFDLLYKHGMRRIARLLENCNPHACGMTSLRSSSRFTVSSVDRTESPVVLPAGRARPAIKPLPNGSAAAPITMGMLCVAVCAARTAGVPPATMTSTFARRTSLISGGYRFDIVTIMAKLKRNVAPFDITEVLHSAHEFLAIWIVVRGSSSDVSDARALAGLLSSTREWRC